MKLRHIFLLAILIYILSILILSGLTFYQKPPDLLFNFHSVDLRPRIN